MTDQIHISPTQLNNILTKTGIHRLVKHYAGLGTFYVPKKTAGKSWESLEMLIGRDDAEALIMAFGGHKVRLSKGRSPLKKIAILEILDAHKQSGASMNTKNIARSVGCDIRYVQQIVASFKAAS